MNIKQKEKLIVPLFSNWGKIIICLCFTFLAIHMIWFIDHVDHSLPIGDSWRYLKNYVEPFYQGSFTIDLLWKDPHPNPIRAFLILFHSKYLQLDFKFELYVGILFRVLIAAAIVSSFIRFQTASNFFLIVLITILSFSFASVDQLHWSVMATANIGFLLSTIFFILFSSYMKNVYSSRDFKARYWYYLIYTEFFFFANRDLATLAMTTILVVLFGIAIFERRKESVKRLLVVLLVFILNYYLFKVLFPSSYTKNIDFIDKLINLFGHLPDFGKTFFLSVLSSLGPDLIPVNYSLLIKVSLGCVIFAVYALLIWKYLSKELWKKNLIPMCFAVMPLISFFMIIWFRYIPKIGAQWNGVPSRYFLLYQLAGIGLIWMLAMVSNALKKKSLYVAISIFITFFVLISEIKSIEKRWVNLERLNNDRAEICTHLYKTAYGEEVFNQKIAKRAFNNNKAFPQVIFMKENHLGFFSERNKPKYLLDIKNLR